LFLLDSHLDLLCRIAKLVDLALMDVQHAVITGGGGSLAAAMMRAMSAPLWQLKAPTRSELDVTDAAAVDSYFKDRPIDLLVCAAGAVADAPLARMGEESWDRIFAVNYQGAADCAAAVLPTMLRQQSAIPAGFAMIFRIAKCAGLSFACHVVAAFWLAGPWA
jgi:NAD(P)-dependent dehydrogenase (short-subunit alcohol dehydrogenase family)